MEVTVMENSVPIYAGAPFVILLLLIAIMPLALPKFWDKNRNKAMIAAIVSLPILLLYFLIINSPQELMLTLKDYFSFIVLLGSLFIISGGILLTGDLKATPATNTRLLFIGAVLANFIGTTGASMLLIRPMLRTNSERKITNHIPVFFIFAVSNIGGCLTPLGDPPLFLGYLKGVPFTWTLTLFPVWVVTLGLVLAIFYFWDLYCYSKETPAAIKKDIQKAVPIGISGKINILFLIGVILAVSFRTPTPYREMIMALMTVLSLKFTREEFRKKNKFSYHPIIEVAVLFIGIFITVVPLLVLLKTRGAELGITQPWQFFWWTGGLSSFLDNAPTYLTFFTLAESVTRAAGNVDPVTIAGVHVDLLRAISCGAVFMGAMTYIGNGPNFMVKSIAEEMKIKIPHFFGYMVYSILILIPIFIVV
ncbi:MAG: sodium:proton antiporter, partial [candidate division Zixibacteria bacterium]|nr:sodium:proton antiporter [candidate division Zixibacteria bacterium]